MLSITNQGILARIPGRFLATPSLVASGDAFLCFATVRKRLFVGEERMARCYIGSWRCGDDLNTWTEQSVQCMGETDDDGYLYAQPMASALKGNRIVLTTQRIAEPGDQYPSRFNPRTGGLAPTEPVWMISDDQGLTWTRPRVPSFSDSSKIDVNCNLLELPDDDWFWPLERWKAWDDPSQLRVARFGLRSSDLSRTWRKTYNFPN